VNNKIKKIGSSDQFISSFSEITEIVKLLVFLEKIGNNRRIRTNFLRIQSDESFAKAEFNKIFG
jgi:hypothetical protein